MLLENFLQGVVSDTTIVGSSDTTNVASLQLALSEIKLNADIPALHQNLIASTSLTFPLNIVQTGIASVSFTLSNPFTASINLLEVNAKASFDGIFLGSINNVDLNSSPISAPGHSNVTSPTLPLAFNLDPTSIIKLLSLRASQKGIDLGPLTSLFQLALNSSSTKLPVTVLSLPIQAVAHGLDDQITSAVDTSAPTCVR
jgi:hypothetical protein